MPFAVTKLANQRPRENSIIPVDVSVSKVFLGKVVEKDFQLFYVKWQGYMI